MSMRDNLSVRIAHWVLFHLILTYDSYLKKVIYGHLVLYHVEVAVAGNTIGCNHDKV